MNLLRRTQETHFSEPRLLESRTPGVAFEMTGTAQWKTRRPRRPGIEGIVRDTIVQRAQEIAITRYADDICGAQDAMNAGLRANPPGSTRYYSSLTAAITLGISDRAKADARKYRRSLARVKRLCFLKEQLYTDPVMLLLDYLERNPGKVAEQPDLADFQKLALKVRGGEQWWCRILDTLDKLASRVPDEDGNLFAMNVLASVLKQAAPGLFGQHQDGARSPQDEDSLAIQKSLG